MRQGLRTDYLPTEQPKESVTFALSGILESEGNILNYQNELGNSLVYEHPDTDKEIVGHCNLTDNRIVLFFKGQTDEIGLLQNNFYTPLVNDISFNFNNRIKTTWKTVRGCEEIVYFIDGENPDRFINVTNLDVHKNDLDNFDTELFSLNPSVQEILIDNVEVLEGGGELEVGSYHIVAELLDDSLNSIGFSQVSNQVNITTNEGIGGFNNDPISDGGVQPSSKSIQISLSNVDTSYSFVRIYVITKRTGRGFTNEVYAKNDLLEVTDSSLTYTLNNINDQDTRESLDTIRVDNRFYQTSKEILQVDRRLVRANVTSKSVDYANFQRTVNQIVVKPSIKTINKAELTPDTTTFQPDEVYALGIRFKFKEGSYSPVFHIPGREATFYDKEQISPDINDTNLDSFETLPRWKHENTGSVNRLSYYEVSTRYSERVDCNGNPVFGDLAGTPIRHHRMPDLQIFDGDNVNLLGLRFSFIDYPSDDIIDHEILIVPRGNNKTVVDEAIAVGKGFEDENQQLYGLIDIPDYDHVDSNGILNNPSNTDYEFKVSEDDDTLQIISPSFLTDSNRDYDYIEFLNNYSRSNITTTNKVYDLAPPYDDWDFVMRPSLIKYTPKSVSMKRRYVVSNIAISTNSIQSPIQEFDKTIINRSTHNPANIIKLKYPVTESGIFKVRLKKDIEPYTNINNLQYKFLSKSNITHNGDVYPFDFTYNDRDFATQPSLLAQSTLFFGVVFTLSSNLGLPVYAVPSALEDTGSDGDIVFRAARLTGINLVSSVNYKLLAEGTDCNELYNGGELTDYFTRKMLEQDQEGLWQFRDNACAEFYGYNKDYNKYYESKSYFSLPITYDFCSKCLETYPNRIIWSPKSLSEDISDSYFITLANDFITIGENTGEVVAVSYAKNRMLVRTKQSMFLMSPNPRVINTDADTAYIGTGDFLSIPSVEFSMTNYGYGGCQHRDSAIQTEHGDFWIDAQAGRVFWFSGQIEELSSEKYGNYSLLRRLLQNTEDVITTYDPYHKHILFHVSKDDRFTLSFSPKYQCWQSFHPYQPDYMFSDRQYLYTTLGNKVFIHNSNIRTNFYGYQFPFVIEYVEANSQTHDLEVIEYYAQTLQDNVDKPYPTFDQVWVYSQDQSTGLQNLIPKTDQYSNQWSNTNKSVVHSEQNYRINALTDLSNNQIVYSTNLTDRQDYYQNSQGYIDKVPVNIDYNRSQWDLIALKNKFHYIRLFFNNTQKIIFDLYNSMKRPSQL